MIPLQLQNFRLECFVTDTVPFGDVGRVLLCWCAFSIYMIMNFQFLTWLYLYRTAIRCMAIHTSGSIFRLYSALKTLLFGAERLISKWKAPNKEQGREYRAHSGTLNSNVAKGRCIQYIFRPKYTHQWRVRRKDQRRKSFSKVIQTTTNSSVIQAFFII